jgi:predicted metal-dependent HD superfamily phosphohydrolase
MEVSMTNRLNLSRAWSGLGLAPPLDDLQAALVTAWSEPHRAYHTLQHLEECLALLASVDPEAHAVEVALWFHDAIYDTHASDNEARSAEWAAREVAASGGDAALVARVTKLIDATRHNAVPVDDDDKLMVDIDLAILGSNETRFREYEGQVAREYAWVPREIYVRERKKILQSFLDREHIYATEMFRERFEANARRNLAWSIETLSV